jgi:SNF family Na+-dependent transporter
VTVQKAVFVSHNSHFLLTGLGYCTLVVITLITIYYQVIIAWTIFYIFASFRSELGWGSCGHDFNTNGEYKKVPIALGVKHSTQPSIKTDLS